MDGIGGIIILLYVFVDYLLAKFWLLLPILVPVIVFYALRRYKTGGKTALFAVFVPFILILTWVLYGLHELSESCQNDTILRSPSEKLGPIDTLLILDGPGRWWMDNKRINIERHSFRGRDGTDYFSRDNSKKTAVELAKSRLVETELYSRYKVTVEPPNNGNFWQRYLTSASITIEERSTGNLVAKISEPAWGGGLAGIYIAALTQNSPFGLTNNYLSCGYAGQEIGVFRGPSDTRKRLYKIADQNLIDQVFKIK